MNHKLIAMDAAFARCQSCNVQVTYEELIQVFPDFCFRGPGGMKLPGCPGPRPLAPRGELELLAEQFYVETGDRPRAVAFHGRRANRHYVLLQRREPIKSGAALLKEIYGEAPPARVADETMPPFESKLNPTCVHGTGPGAKCMLCPAEPLPQLGAPQNNPQAGDNSVPKSAPAAASETLRPEPCVCFGSRSITCRADHGDGT